MFLTTPNSLFFTFFFFNDTATTEIYTLSLHDALPISLGGGKAVIIGDPRRMKTEGLLRAFGRAVDGLNGRYLTAEDVGMTVADMEIVRKETKHVTGTSEKKCGSGDPSHPTAKGVFYAIETCLKEVYGDPSVRNRTVAIQGVGKAGYQLGELLATSGARLIIADTDPQRAMLARRAFEAWRGKHLRSLQ